MEGIAQKIEMELRVGDLKVAKKMVTLIHEDSKERKDFVRRYGRHKLSNFLRRLGESQKAYLFLFPYFKSDKKLLEKPTVLDQQEFCFCLISLGQKKQALKIIEQNTGPTFLLTKAFLDMSNWDYLNATKNLVEYIEKTKLDEYENIVAHINLLACSVFLNNTELFDKCSSVISKSIHKYSRLSTNFFELNLQNAVLKKDLEQAHYLTSDDAEIAGKKYNVLDFLFVKKWKVILDLMTCNDRATQNRFNNLRRLAVKKKHYETCRDLDYHKACILEDRKLLEKVYFGTPYLTYQKRIEKDFLKLFGENPKDISQYKLMPKNPNELNLINGSILNSDYNFDINKNIFKYLECIFSDFYRPTTFVKIFNDVHGSELYNPASSHNTVSQTIFRLREVLKQHLPGLKLYVEGTSISYELTGLSVVIKDLSVVALPFTLANRLHLLEKEFGHAKFNRKQAATALSLSDRAVNNVIKDLIIEDKLETIGKGRGIKYKIPRVE